VSDNRKEISEAVGGVLAANPGSWKDLSDLGFTGLTVPEELGGSGGDLRDAAVVVAEAARHHAPLPIAEALFLAGPMVRGTALEWPVGVVTSAVGSLTASDGSRITGILPGVPWLRDADYLVTLVRTEGRQAVAVLPARAPGLTMEPGTNLAGEHRDTAILTNVVPERLELVPYDEPDWVPVFELLGAAVRAVQIGGAARAVLELAVRHAGERVQFGRTLDKFQAVQQLLARLAADTATVTVAADAAVLALDKWTRGTELLTAAAKAEASSLATSIAATGHQIHGAIGYTAEHRLGNYTKRLWSWRQEYGNELHWHRRIAELIDGADGQLWPLVTNTEGFST
jgi:acyl-CoA dehydrogenase